jgi:N-acetylglucosaminyldiphosphoundecaprenol N-acetyl-beta-D-mannosaminyltransferase
MIGNPRFIWRVIRWRLFGLPDRVNLRRVRFNTVFPPDARPVIPHTRVMNIPVHLFTTEILHKTLHHLIAQGERAVVANVNMHAMVLARHDSDFERFLHHADYVFCDGAGVMLAALWLNREQIPERITYADWLPALAGFCSDHHLKLFFLGGREGVARRAAEKLVSQYPDLQIAGTHHGFFDKTAASAENEKVLCEINASGAHILVVAFGMPLQEAWLERNWDKLQCHVALTGGAALDYVSGTLRRPPRWMYRHGLEWLGRMAIEPMRLGKRYVQDIVRFFSALLRYKFAGKDKRLGNVRL